MLLAQVNEHKVVRVALQQTGPADGDVRKQALEKLQVKEGIVCVCVCMGVCVCVKGRRLDTDNTGVCLLAWPFD